MILEKKRSPVQDPIIFCISQSDLKKKKKIKGLIAGDPLFFTGADVSLQLAVTFSRLSAFSLQKYGATVIQCTTRFFNTDN